MRIIYKFNIYLMASSHNTFCYPIHVTKNTIWIIFLFFAFNSFGQKYDLTLSEQKILPHGLLMQKMLYNNKSGYYIHFAKDTNQSKTINYLLKFDTNFKCINELALPLIPKRSVNELFYIKGKYGWLQSGYDADSSSLFYKIIPVSFNGELAKEVIVGKNEKPDLIERQAGIIQSPDTSLFLFYNSKTFGVFKEDRILSVAIYNSDFELIAEKDLTNLLKGTNSIVNSVTLTDDTTAYVLLTMTNCYQDTKNQAGNTTNKNCYRLIAVNGRDKSTKILEIDPRNKYFTRLLLLRDNNNILHCCGFYATVESGPVTGIFDYSVLKSGNLQNMLFRDFSFDEMQKCEVRNVSNVKETKYGKGLDPMFGITDVVSLANGNIVYVSGETYLKSVQTTAYTTVNYFSSKCILLFTFSESYDLKDIKVIPNWQSTKYSYLSVGNILLYNGSKLACVYNESRKNMKAGIDHWDAYKKYTGKGVISFMQLNENQNLTRDPVPDNNEIPSPVLITQLCERISGDDFFVVLQDEFKPAQAKYIFGRLRLK